MKRSLLIILFGGGLALTALGLSGLRGTKEGLRHHQNPFAVQGSGFGRVIARLSQNTINVAWHLGIEGVNPEHCHSEGEGDDHDQDHHEHGHDHAGHDHADHESPDGDQPVVLTEEERRLLAGAGLDAKSMHCEHCAKAAVAAVKAAPAVAGAAVTAPVTGAEEPGHVHDEHCGHDHGAKSARSGEGWLGDAAEWLHDLTMKRHDRTNPKGVSAAHKLAISQEIANQMLRAYKMDPTDYGVYNGYFLFLTIHEFGGGKERREHARTISDLTVGEALREQVDPQPLQTAAMATLNRFFLDQEDYDAKGEKLPLPLLREYKQKMAYLLHRSAVLMEQAKQEGRWEAISEERREAMIERQNLAAKSAEQFDKLIALVESGKDGGAKPGSTASSAAPVAGSSSAGEREPGR